MQLRDLAALLVGVSVDGDPAVVITGIQTDSRLVKPGDLFICINGTTYDGHDFATHALEQGAVALVTQRPLQVEANTILVKDTQTALAIFADHYYGYPSHQLQVIGITGTNGKTTISYLIEKILMDQGRSTGLMGTIRMKIGASAYDVKNTTQDALTLQRSFREMCHIQTNYCIMEVSSHALVQGRVKGCRFRTAIFSNLSQDHLDFHASMEQYKLAKGLLFAQIGNTYTADEAKRQYVVLNADDAASSLYQKMTAAQVITYGIDQQADVYAKDVRMDAYGTYFTLTSFAGSCDIRLKLVGRFSVYNALAATAATLLEGVPLPEIKASLEAMPGVEGRFERVETGRDFLVIVDYAHTPDSLENVLITINEFAEARIICVFGCGGDRDKSKRPRMGTIAAQYSDFVIVTNDNPRTEDPEIIMDEIEAGLTTITARRAQNYERIADRELAIESALALAGPGDVVLIAGKGHETYQETNGVRKHFDDRVVVKKILRRTAQ